MSYGQAHIRKHITQRTCERRVRDWTGEPHVEFSRCPRREGGLAAKSENSRLPADQARSCFHIWQKAAGHTTSRTAAFTQLVGRLVVMKLGC